MRATLESDGTLRITPETATEAYALACWQDGQKRRKGKPALAVETAVQGTIYGTTTLANWPPTYLGSTATIPNGTLP